MTITSTKIDVEALRIRVENAIVWAELGETTSVMPNDVFESAEADSGWTTENGLFALRTILYEQLGNESIHRGEAEELVTRYNSQQREFKSPERPCVSAYLSLVLPQPGHAYKPYVKFEIGPLTVSESTD